jgi:hypothetical protein
MHTFACFQGEHPSKVSGSLPQYLGNIFQQEYSLGPRQPYIEGCSGLLDSRIHLPGPTIGDLTNLGPSKGVDNDRAGSPREHLYVRQN